MAPFECLDLRICFSITRDGLITTQLPHNGVGCLCIAYLYHWIWMWLLMRFVMFSYSNDSVTVLASLAMYTPGRSHIWPVGLDVFSSAHIHPPPPAGAVLVSPRICALSITFFCIHFAHLYHSSLTPSMSALVRRWHATVCGCLAGWYKMRGYRASSGQNVGLQAGSRKWVWADCEGPCGTAIIITKSGVEHKTGHSGSKC